MKLPIKHTVTSEVEEERTEVKSPASQNRIYLGIAFRFLKSLMQGTEANNVPGKFVEEQPKQKIK